MLRTTGLLIGRLSLCSTKIVFSCSEFKALFIWSRVPETTLPPSYPGRANFSLISLKNSTNCLHENASSSRGGETTRVPCQAGQLFPRDAPVGHGRGNNPVEYVFFIFVTRSHKKQCRILIEV